MVMSFRPKGNSKGNRSISGRSGLNLALFTLGVSPMHPFQDHPGRLRRYSRNNVFKE